MSFFNGMKTEEATGEFEEPNNFDPMPNDTNVIACIDEAKRAEDFHGNDHVAIRWSVLAPAEYKGRKINQKLWVVGSDKPNSKNPAADREKSQRMLIAIDHNAGGQLAKSGDTTDAALTSALVNKMMCLNLGYYEFEVGKKDDGTPDLIKGNNIRKVSPKSKNGSTAPPSPVAAPSVTTPGVSDDDIPF